MNRATPIKVNTRLDQIDAERFDAMLNSGSFALLRFRIQAELDRAKLDCESKNDGIDVRRAQGRVAALRSVIEMPAQILKEIQAKAAR